jgi:hypothetical protein
MNKLFIIPQENQSLIARLEKGTVITEGKIDLPYHSKSVITENALIVSLCLAEKLRSRRLKIFDTRGGQLVRKAGYQFTCLAHKNNTVYLGGQYHKNRRELFAALDVYGFDLSAEEIALPLQSVEGKSIDDILVRGNSLILVDNLLFPKYLFEYDISEAANPVHLQTIELPNNGTYEHIYKGAANEKYLVLLSGSVGRNGMKQHISIHDIHGAPLIALSWALDEAATQKAPDRIFDIALYGNKLLLLREDALCRLDLDGQLAKDALRAIAPNDGMEKIIAAEDGVCVMCNRNRCTVVALRDGSAK